MCVGHVYTYRFTQSVGINHGYAESELSETVEAVIAGINQAVVVGCAERDWNG
jgi:hypothetical protein